MRNRTVYLCLLAAAALVISACAATEEGVVTYVEKPDAGAMSYVDSSGGGAITYSEPASMPLSAGRTHVDPFPRKKAVELTAEQKAFVAARTPEDYERFIEKYKPSELAFVAVQRLARPYVAARDWDSAVRVYERYRDDFPDMTGRFASIIAILESPDEHLEIEQVGGGVNSAADELSPVVSADGMTMFFARECGECRGGEDIYVARNHNGVWGGVTKLGKPFNTPADEMPLAVSADSNRIAVFGNYADSNGRGDIYYVEKGPDGWSARKHYAEPVNTEHFEAGAMYTADGKAMLFVSDRPGGVGEYHPKGEFFHGNLAGNTDIYVYVTHENGESEVINLGPVINTPYAEYSPYLHPDGKTLYFSSDGHSGLGGLDVFKSTRLSDTSWTLWSEPVNLGKEVNGPYNDWGYQVATSGKKAWFASSRQAGSVGGSDIYSVAIPEKVKPSGVITISGVIRDPEGNPLEADIRWSDLGENREVGHAKSDPQTGSYFITLPSGGQYGYYAEKEGYMGESESFDLRDDYEFREYTLDIVLYPIKKLTSPPPVQTVADEGVSVPEKVVQEAVEKPIRLNNIFFDFNKWNLRRESFMELDRWVRLMQDNPQITLEVYGHTDSIGSQAYNLKLSRKRAEAVVAYLVNKGIDKARFKVFGMGETVPVASNDTEEGRQRNRRVEVKINIETAPPAGPQAAPTDQDGEAAAAGAVEAAAPAAEEPAPAEEAGQTSAAPAGAAAEEAAVSPQTGEDNAAAPAEAAAAAEEEAAQPEEPRAPAAPEISPVPEELPEAAPAAEPVTPRLVPYQPSAPSQEEGDAQAEPAGSPESSAAAPEADSGGRQDGGLDDVPEWPEVEK